MRREMVSSASIALKETRLTNNCLPGREDAPNVSSLAELFLASQDSLWSTYTSGLSLLASGSSTAREKGLALSLNYHTALKSVDFFFFLYIFFYVSWYLYFVEKKLQTWLFVIWAFLQHFGSNKLTCSSALPISIWKVFSLRHFPQNSAALGFADRLCCELFLTPRCTAAASHRQWCG